MAAHQQFVDIEGKESSGAGSGGRGDAGEAGLWRAALAELAGSALLVLASCLPGAFGAPSLHRALGAGAAVAMLVQCLDHISMAMLNPAVALAGALAGRISWRRAALYACVQLAGAAVGAAATAALTPHHGNDGLGEGSACGDCVTRMARGLCAWRGAALEALLTACLVLANLAAWDPRNIQHKDSWPLRIGATVTALSLAAGEATGASMNPARSFGPALCAGDWRHHWVYWVGPLGGTLAAALLHRAAWRPART